MHPSFFTKVPVRDFPFQISYEKAILSIGSCFVENIGNLLEEHKFNHLQNPFGVLYHPLVIARNLERLANSNLVKEEELFENQGLWRHFDFHSRYAHPDKKTCLNLLNTQIQKGHAFLQTANILIVSLGTAIGHYQQAEDVLVGNCHKLPGNNFIQKKSKVVDCVTALKGVFEQLQTINPSLQIVLTVSPVRHIKSGLVESQRSKATLLLAAEELCQSASNIHYFPSYELILDELRDYRFFTEDLIHPNQQAIQLVWQKFIDASCSEETQKQMVRILSIVKAAAHRPNFPALPAHQAFLQKQLADIQQMEIDFPKMNWVRERGLLERQLV